MTGMRKKLVLYAYDLDSLLGINNEGELTFKSGMEYTDHLEGGANIWNGQDSVLYINERLSFDEERAAMYRALRQQGKWSYEVVDALFTNHQSKWPERMVNEDSRYKYEVPYLEGGNGTYLGDLLGLKTWQRRKLLFENFWYFDSKWIAGDALKSVFTVRAYAKSNVTLTPYQDLYVTAKFGSYTVQQRTKRGVAKTLTCPVDALNDTEVYFYCAERLSSVGDISGLKPGLVDASAAVKLRELKIGDESEEYENPNLKTLTLGNNTLLQVVDARGSIALGTGNQKSVDLSGCENIEEIYLDRTSVTGVSLPVGGVLRILHLPETTANLTIRNQKKITEFVLPSYENIKAVRLENNGSAIDTLAILRAIPANTNIRIIGFTWEAEDAADIESILDTLDTMQGIDVDGQGRDISVASCINTVSGTIHTASLTGEQVASYNERYPYITIQADAVTSYRTYADYDGTVLKVVECHDGVPQEDAPTGLTRENSSDGQYSYTFVGWSKSMDAEAADSDALDNVIADRTIYAAYSKTVRTYTVTWKNTDNTALETDTDVPWGTTPTYNGSAPTYNGQTYTGWTPTPAAITGDTAYTATYIPVYNVYFYNGSTLLQTVEVQQGGTATYTGDTPTDGDKIFTGWSPSPTNVQGNLSTYAQFKANIETPTATSADGAYGVEWDYSKTASTLTRKGLAASFSDPAPAEGVSGSGSSPFDSIMPWAGMKRYNVIGSEYVPETDSRFDQAANDTVVYIPEFYYTAYKDTANSKWLWAISPTAKEGYCKHPGSGRYVGRYHTGGSSSGVYTKSGVTPLANTSQTSFRSYSASKGSGWGMMDLATWSAIQMLYLVEFAHFNSQDKLGKGWNTGSVGTMGGTDSAVYHTVKMDGAHNQYRWIEDPYSNVRDWIDGFYGSQLETYAAANDSYDGETDDLNKLGVALPTSGQLITGIGYSESAAWAIIPDASSSSATETTYVCDCVFSYSSLYSAYVGGSHYDSTNAGLFFFCANHPDSYTNAGLGSRLQKI